MADARYQGSLPSSDSLEAHYHCGSKLALGMKALATEECLKKLLPNSCGADHSLSFPPGGLTLCPPQRRQIHSSPRGLLRAYGLLSGS